MPFSTRENKLSLVVKGFRRVNEYASPELLAEDELAILKNCVLDQQTGVPSIRNPFQQYNVNANSAPLASMSDVLIGTTDYILGVDATVLYKSSGGTGTWASVKTGLTSNKIMRICQYSGKLYCVNGFDAPFQTDLTTTANLAITKPDVSAVTVTPAITGGAMAAGQYYYTLVYKDSNGNFSPPSHCLHAQIDSGVAGRVAFASLPTTSDKYLYRTKVGEGTFYLVAVIGATTTSYTDRAADTSLDLSNTVLSVNVPTSAYYALVKNDRLFLANIKSTPYNFPTAQSNNDIVFDEVVGVAALNNTSTYKWKMALIFSDGTESEASDPITHVTGASKGGDGTLIVTVNLIFPTGFSNVSAVKFYRTVAGGSTYYFDYSTAFPNPISRGYTLSYQTSVSDAALVANAQLAAASSTTYGSRIVWSDNAKPATIQTLSFIDVYPDDGDVITGLVDDGDGILIFKMNNIYKLYTRGEPENYYVQKVLTGKGCSDPNTLVASPKGIFFLYRRHIYKYLGPNTEPEDISLLYQTTLSTVSSYRQAFYHAAYEWIVFPIINTNGYLLIYDTKLGTWYNFTSGGVLTSWSAFSRQYGADAGKMILSMSTTLGWYTEPAGALGLDVYPSGTATSVQIRSKTFLFPEGIGYVRPRFLWLNLLVITGFAITHTLSDPDQSLSATVAQAATQTGQTRTITDSMTTPILKAGKLYYDLTGTYLTKFYGWAFEGTILRRGMRL